MHNDYTAIIEPCEEGGFAAFCAEVPGANGQGETVEAAIENLSEAIKLVLSVNRDQAFGDMQSDAQLFRVTIDEAIKITPLPDPERMRNAS